MKPGVNEFEFPKGDELRRFLALEHAADLDDLILKTLFQPLETLLARPSKSLRSDLVRLGFAIGRADGAATEDDLEALDEVCALIELFHAGSLIVDDIEDGSLSRRGAPSVHSLYGIPVALNAANWLYFLPLERIPRLPIAETRQQRLIAECHRMLLRGHFGQALDVGVCVDQLERERVYDVSLAAMELKSGVLSAFAIKAGAITAGATPVTADRIEKLGRRLGVALQMFDDIGNVSSERNLGKRAEDLRLRRLGYISAAASRHLTEGDFTELSRLSSRLPDSIDEVQTLLTEKGVFGFARREAEAFLLKAIEEICATFAIGPVERASLEKFKTALKSSYD